VLLLAFGGCLASCFARHIIHLSREEREINHGVSAGST
jgi:hypothetical protein